MRSRWRIRHKFAAGLALVLGMTAILSAGSFYGLYSYRGSNKVFDYHHQQLQLLRYVDYTLIDLMDLNTPNGESGARSRGGEGAALAVRRIQEMVRDYRDALQSASEKAFAKQNVEAQVVVIRDIEACVRNLNESVRGLRPTADVNTPNRSWFFTGNVRGTIFEMRNLLSRLSGLLHEEINRHIDADKRNYRGSLAVVYSTSVLVLVMLIVLVYLGYRAVFQPLRVLHRFVTRLSEGNFDSRVELDTGDEMQELGEAFNEMADRLQSIYHGLNRQVEERSRQLIRSERLASVGFLAAGVAHEINNPLASIAFCAEALESRLAPVLTQHEDQSEIAHNYLQMIQQEAFRCKAITEKLLDFSRVGEAERVETDLVALLRSVVEMVQHLGRTEGKNLIFEPTESVVSRVNPQELKQVLLNLTINALESIDPGGVVSIQAEQRPDGVVLAVSDDGC
ncbi:MAG: sensor histidine kinase, partial [Planctomycetia bacterium]